MKNVHERNALRMQVWEVDEQLTLQKKIPEAYRNTTKIQQLRDQIEQLEEKIKVLSER